MKHIYTQYDIFILSMNGRKTRKSWKVYREAKTNKPLLGMNHVGGHNVIKSSSCGFNSHMMIWTAENGSRLVPTSTLFFKLDLWCEGPTTIFMPS